MIVSARMKQVHQKQAGPGALSGRKRSELTKPCILRQEAAQELQENLQRVAQDASKGRRAQHLPCQLLARRFSCVKTCWSTSRTRCGRRCRTAFVCIVLAQDLSTLPVSERNLLAQHLGCSHVWPWESSSEPPDVSSFAAPGLVRTVRRLLMLILLQTTCFLSYPGPADAPAIRLFAVGRACNGPV